MAYPYQPIAMVLVLVVLTFDIANGDVFFVSPNVADCNVSTSCNTLSYYASSTTQQLSDSVLYFMPGTHLLQQVWVIENVSNLTLTGRSPNSEADEQVIVECTDSSTDQGIRVINGRNITLKYLAIFYCQQDKEGIWDFSSSLFCDSTNNLELSDVTIGFSSGSCLHLINCTDYAITNSTFTKGSYGIFVGGISSGKLTSISLLNNYNGMSVQSIQSENITKVQLDWVYASLNVNFDFWFSTCSTDISLRNSQSLDSGGFFAYQNCILPEIYEIEIHNCSFNAMKQGIVVFVSQAQDLQISISSCSVSDTAGEGFSLGVDGYPGIGIIKNMPSIEKEKKEPKFIIQNVTIENIHGPDLSVPALFLYAIPLVEITDVSVLNNGHGGLVLFDSVAVFRGTNTFRNNSAIYGGGMALYANSYMLLESNATLNLIDNKATKYGGGIFVSQDETWPWINLCFLEFADRSPKIRFEGNEAETGSKLYGGKIGTCLKDNYFDASLTEVFGLLRNATPCGQTKVSSDAVRITFCDDSCIDTTTTEKEVSLYPGSKLNISIAAVGQLSGLTQASVLLHYDEVFEYDMQDTTEFINYSCTNFVRDIRVKRAITQANITLALSTDYDQSSSFKNITVAVNLLPCPAGFNFSQDTYICVCSDSIKDNAECDITTQTITRNGPSWIDPTNESIMFFEHCPFDYCNTEPFSVDNRDAQCDHSRSGTLCGDCIQGYSLTLGSNTCFNCTGDDWKTTFIPLGCGLFGMVLVAVLIALNFTVSVGTVNGFLFFANVVKIYESTFLHKNYSKVLYYLYSWLNLDLGIQTCYYDGMDACQKVGLQFGFPICLLFVVMLIIATCRCTIRPPWCVKFTDKTALFLGSKIVPVLATLLLFSYTKLVRSTILIYHKADLQVFENNTNTCISVCDNTSRWYVNGSVEYLTGCHGVLFGLGTGIIVPLISLFTAFLLFFPLMERYLPRVKFWSSWHMRLKPWYDAYGGPYKDEYRFWTGLLLLVRCLLVAVVTIVDDPNAALSVLTWLCLILIPMVALLQVYKSSILNILEIIYLSSILAMVFLSTAYQDDVQLSLVLSISLCLLFTILLFHTGQRLKPIWSAVMVMRKKRSASEQEHSDNQNEYHASMNVSMSTVSAPDFTELREALLSDNN